MSLGTEQGLGPGHFMLDEDTAPFHKKGAEPPKFPVHAYCSQTDGRTKMVLGMDVGLNLDDFVLDGEPVPLPKKGWTPQNRPMFIVAKRLDKPRCHLV